jgi:hypothetical protein
MKTLMSFGAGVLALALAGTAGATSIDFRAGAFEPGSAVNHLSQAYGGYYFDLDALRSSDLHHEGTLFWDSSDGFGIKNSNNWDADEIEGNEVLSVAFGESIYVHSFRVADLFIETGLQSNLVEHGYFSIDGGSHWGSFYADGAHVNGEVSVHVGATTDGILFKSAGSTGYRQGHEFSLVSVDIDRGKYDPHEGPAVPEPSAAVLFAAGSLLVGRRSRRT